jgi:diaminopimelate decarboxylase
MHIKSMSKIKDDALKLWYACKSNPASAIIDAISDTSFGVDISSSGELSQALGNGIPGSRILSTGPSKTKEYLKLLIKSNVEIIVLESINQLIWLNEIISELNIKQKVLLRVQLEWGAGESVLGGDQITPFGLDPDAWRKIDYTEFKNINILGFHVFQWGNILDLQNLESIWRKIIVEMNALSKDLKINMTVIDLGGGIGIPYDKADKDIDFNDVNDLVLKLKNEFSLDSIWLEPGRYCTGPYGHYFTQVTDRKTVREKEILVLEGGINHLARPALTGNQFPCESFRESNEASIEFHLHGPLCTALDKMGVYQLPEDINVGDLLVFSQVGAYGFTESMPYFLCHNLPAEVILLDGHFSILRDVQSSSDWLV